MTGLTSSPTVFDLAIKNSAMYDADIARKAPSTKLDEDLFFDLVLADLRRAADLFRPVYAQTDSVDGWVSLEVSPLMAHDTTARSPLPRRLIIAAAGPTSSSRVPAPPMACRPSKRQSSPAFPSTSPCSSHASSISRWPTPICAASSGASRPASTGGWRSSSTAASWSTRWGTQAPVPVEVVPFGLEATGEALKVLGAGVHLWLAPLGDPFVTDRGYHILDCCLAHIHRSGTPGGTHPPHRRRGRERAFHQPRPLGVRHRCPRFPSARQCARSSRRPAGPGGGGRVGRGQVDHRAGTGGALYDNFIGGG